MKITGFIPCRAGSERVLNKNTRPFAGVGGGLLGLKLEQLSRVSRLTEIVVSSNDPVVLDFAADFSAKTDQRVIPVIRPNEYGLSSTSMEEFIKDYIAHLREEGVLFWTHVTHPFVNSTVYEHAIDKWEVAQATGHDSLVSVTRLHRFLWRDGKPFNYDNSLEKWPRSQDIRPVYDINHAIYAIPFQVMRKTGDRIGSKPMFYEMDENIALDIDWENQFNLLEEIALIRSAHGISLY